MKYVKLGNSGVDVSRICLGMMSFGKLGSSETITGSLDGEDSRAGQSSTHFRP